MAATAHGLGFRRASYWLALAALLSAAGCNDRLVAPGGEALATLLIVPQQISLSVGDATAFEVVPENEAGRRLPMPTVTWSVSDSSVLSVDFRGVVTVHSEGQSDVTARSGDLSVTATVRAIPAPAPEWREHTCAMSQAGRLLCWGRNVNGVLGTGSRTSSAVPVPVAG